MWISFQVLEIVKVLHYDRTCNIHDIFSRLFKLNPYNYIDLIADFIKIWYCIVLGWKNK